MRSASAFGYQAVSEFGIIALTIAMPEISRFHGIVIYMNYREHPPPHFHAKHQEEEITVEILSGVVEGKMSRRLLRFVIEWSEQHQRELMDDWRRAQNHQELIKIAPLQ